jgi:hypothetical protein
MFVAAALFNFAFGIPLMFALAFLHYAAGDGRTFASPTA